MVFWGSLSWWFWLGCGGLYVVWSRGLRGGAVRWCAGGRWLIQWWGVVVVMGVDVALFRRCGGAWGRGLNCCCALLLCWWFGVLRVVG